MVPHRPLAMRLQSLHEEREYCKDEQTQAGSSQSISKVLNCPQAFAQRLWLTRYHPVGIPESPSVPVDVRTARIFGRVILSSLRGICFALSSVRRLYRVYYG